MLNIFLEIYLLGSILFGILLWMTLVVAKKNDHEQGYDIE